MSSAIYKITCLTNLSVGSGEANFSVIDNEVEKDLIGLPIINASGLKGALREFFTKSNTDPDIIKNIFGSDVKDSAKNMTQSMPGNLKFIDAHTIALPCRASKGKRAYYMAVPVSALENANEIFLACGYGKPFAKIPSKNENHTQEDDIGIEGIGIGNKVSDTVNPFEIFDLKDYVLLNDSSMKKINLPVLARNQLENGLSNNLWYEEVVPHKSIMFFAVLGEEKCMKDFDNVANNKVIQFGGNASIGRGLCLVEKIK